MKAIEYPIVKLYLDEARKAFNECLYLSCIAVCGITSEIMIREKAADMKERENISRILKTLLKRGKISEKQFIVFEKIREIRNRYVHLNLGTNAEASFYGGVVEENGTATFVVEYIRQADDPESELLKFHRLFAETDSKEMLRLVEETLSELEISVVK